MRQTAMGRSAWIALWVTGALASGCGGGGGGGGGDSGGNNPPAPSPPPPPPASVAGTWTPEYTDPASADSSSLLTNCSGDLSGDEGSAVLTGGFSCGTEDPIRVSQTGGDFQIEPMACADSAGAESAGGGTVTGNDLAGEFTITAPDETQIVEFAGQVTDLKIDLSATRIEVSGARSGACDISPPSTSVVAISE